MPQPNIVRRANGTPSASAEVADRFRASVDHAVDRILDQGDSLPKLVADYRYVRVGRFPYLLIFYATAPTLLMVFAVAHTSRRPGYWRRRK